MCLFTEQKKFNKIFRYIGNFLCYYKQTDGKIEEKMNELHQKRADMERKLEEHAAMEKRMMETIRITEEKQKNCAKVIFLFQFLNKKHKKCFLT